MRSWRYCLYHLVCLLTKRIKIISFQEKAVVNFSQAIPFTIFFLSLLIQKNVSGQSPTEQSTSNTAILNTRITLSLKNTSIQKILDTLSSTNKDIRFSYVNYELPLQNSVDLEVKDQPLGIVLDSVFRDQGIQYFIVSKQIVLKKKEKKSPVNNISFETSFLNRLSYSMMIGGGISYRHLHSNDRQLVNIRNESERSIFNITAGSYVTLQYSKSLFFRGGIVLVNAGEKGSYQYLVTNSDSSAKKKPKNTVPSAANANGSTTTAGEITYINNYNYLSFPLMAGYSLQKKKWHFSGFSGMGIAFLLHQSTKFSDNTKGETGGTPQYSYTVYHPLKGTIFLYTGMIETGYRLNRNWGVSGAFSFTYFMSSIYSSNNFVKCHPYNASTLLGLTYYLSAK